MLKQKNQYRETPEERRRQYLEMSGKASRPGFHPPTLVKRSSKRGKADHLGASRPPEAVEVPPNRSRIAKGQIGGFHELSVASMELERDRYLQSVDLPELKCFFRRRRGRGELWRYLNWTDRAGNAGLLCSTVDETLFNRTLLELCRLRRGLVSSRP